MEFSQSNPIVRLCLQGIGMEAKGQAEEAGKIFLQAWNEAEYDFEKFIAAHFLARQQKSDADRLHWLETALQLALKMNDSTVKSAFAPLYTDIAKCHEALGNADEAKRHFALAAAADDSPSDNGPFYHGTKADLQIGDFLNPGNKSNYKDELTMNHIYFTAMANGAGLAAALAKGEGRERVYVVEPAEGFENDPNVTNKYFPGNPTRSYRTHVPMKIVGEVTDWAKQTPEALQKWKERLANNKGEIIN